MKLKIKHLFLLASMLVCSLAFGQVPQKFNYQGIARDIKGNPIAHQNMSLKIAVLPTQDATVAEYEEIQNVKTNEFGLYTIQIGTGTPLTGEMKTVKWETGNKYIKVSIDSKGGDNFVDLGTTQLLSVPYAIYADKAGIARETVETTTDKTRAGTVSTSAAGTGTTNYLTKFTAANTIYNSQLFDNGTNIGFGTTTPSAKLHIANTVAGVQEQIRMQNLSPTGAGRFTMYNDGGNSYATFTKYATTYAGSYIPTLYPLANLLAFGNNGPVAGDGNGRFLISSGGNIGISIYKSGASKLKFHADFATENVGIGGSASPKANVHFNNALTGDTLKLTNTTTGHLVTDGLDIRNNGNDAEIINRENASLAFGTNNAERMRVDATGNVLIGRTTSLNNTWYKLALFQPNASQGSAMYLQTADAGSTEFDGAQISLTNGTTPSLQFLNREAGAITFLNNGYTERMRITPNGNVGIGTAMPTAKLFVTGFDDITPFGWGSTLSSSVAVVDSAAPTSALAEKTGIYSAVKGGNYNYGILSEVIDEGNTVNYGLFGRVSKAPTASGESTGLLAYDAIGATNTYAAKIYGKMVYTNGASYSTGAVLVNDGGGVASWSGPVAFKANGQVGGSLASNFTIDTVKYSNEAYDLSTSYDPTTGLFTVPTDGIYHFDYSTEISGNGGATGGYLQISLMKNGSFVEGTFVEESVSQFNSWKTISASADVQLVAGDEIYVTFYNGTNTAQNVTSSSYYNTFSGHIVR